MSEQNRDKAQRASGHGLEFVVLDEGTFMVPETWPEPLQSPRANRRRVIQVISTPRARNWFAANMKDTDLADQR